MPGLGLTLPLHLHVFIARRMKPRSLCRFRQTCKAIDNLVEFNRLRIGARTDDIDWVFLMSVNSVDHQTAQFHVFAGNLLDFYELEPKLLYDQDLIKIDNPYRQLSGIRFDIIFASLLVEFDPNTDEWNPHQLRLSEETFIQNIIPIIKTMKLECDWLASSLATSFERLALEVSFTKCFISHPTIQTSVLINWKVLHCTELEIALITDEPECETVCKMIGQAKKANFLFSGDINVFEILQSFLREISTDRSSVKNLQWLQLHSLSERDSNLNLPGLVEIWKGEIHSSPVKGSFVNGFLKCPVDNGVAVICYDLSPLIDVYITAAADRETLLNCLYPHMFCGIPFDCSAVFEKFLEAQTDTLAFDLLRDYYLD